MEGDVAIHTSLVFEHMNECAKTRLGRDPDFVERLSVLLHDLKKPESRVDDGDGGVTFPGHEKLAALEVPTIAGRLGLTEEEEAKLYFLVAEHGEASRFLALPEDTQGRLWDSPFLESLALLQEADALSCIKPDGTPKSVYWDLMMSRGKR